MGGGAKKAHESFGVAPADTAPEGLDTLSAAELGALSGAGAAADAMAAYQEALAQAKAAAEDPALEPPEAYAALKAGVEEASQHLEEAAQAGLPTQLAAEHQADLKGLTGEYLASLEPAQLQELAAGEGFEHPTLVGLNGPGAGKHPLVHWLDPAYPASSQTKLAIQAKAAERYAALAAGQSVAGLSLAEVQAAEAHLGAAPPPGMATWGATPADVVKAQARLSQALVELKTYAPTGEACGVGEVLEAENQLATASCPELGAELDVAKASGKAAVDKALAQGSLSLPARQELAQLVEAAQHQGALSSAEAKLLGSDEHLALMRASTPATERAGLAALAQERQGQLDALAGLKAAYEGHFAGGHLALEPAQASDFAATAGGYLAKRKEVAAWAGQAAAASEVVPLSGHSWAGSYQAQELTKSFRAWAKTQKLADLRASAAAMGLPADSASRAEVQNYMAGSWDPNLDQAKIAASVAAKAAAKKAPATSPAKAAAPPPKSPSAPPPATPSPAPAAAPPAPAGFAAKHLALVESLKAHQAIAADLPARPGAAEVAEWSFGPAQAAHLGGAHSKSLHAAPDGSMWMFKPDTTSGGARAHAEAAASEVFSRVGVPSVPVYARAVGSKVGSIQPLVSGAANLSGDAKSWSQGDVDNLVRYHVAAWAVGDHDGNAHNVLRTPSGGLCPVDQGQAFKFFGRDRLAPDYQPNSSYGSVAVFHQAYGAAKAGQLGPGVRVRPEAALPVIKAFESLPDDQYRSMLGPVATEGVKHGVHWVEPMRKAARKRLGKTQVSSAEVAEQFLHTAVERKNALRSSFSSFFASLGLAGSHKLDKVA